MKATNISSGVDGTFLRVSGSRRHSPNAEASINISSESYVHRSALVQFQIAFRTEFGSLGGIFRDRVCITCRDDYIDEARSPLTNRRAEEST